MAITFLSINLCNRSHHL